MDLETLALLKLIIAAGLAYLTLRKTRQINETHQIAQSIKKQCKIEDITMRSEPIVRLQSKTLEQEKNKIVSYEQFTKYHQRIGREQSVKQQASDSESIDIFSCEGCDQNDRFSTAPSEDKRETFSLKSSHILELDDRESTNKLYWEATNLNKPKHISMPLVLKNITKTPTRIFKPKKIFAKNKHIKKGSFYKKSKDHNNQSRT